MGFEREDDERGDWSPWRKVRGLGGQSFRRARAPYCSPSGRKTNFDQILLRPHKTDHHGSPPVPGVMVPINDSSIR